ncbi:hypothetical protein KPB01_38645, partial [Burkholderia sola]|nr:hypothetical protein [Burkholderia sola]
MTSGTQKLQSRCRLGRLAVSPGCDAQPSRPGNGAGTRFAFTRPTRDATRHRTVRGAGDQGETRCNDDIPDGMASVAARPTGTSATTAR